MKRFWTENALSIVLLLAFFLFWLIQALTGWAVHNQDLQELGQHTLGFGTYLTSAHFWSATAENWESEFLQMGAYVVLTIYLKQRGSAESNPYPDEEAPEQRLQEEQDDRIPGFWRRDGLSVTLFSLFAASWLIHLLSSWQDYSHEAQAKGEAAVSLLKFLHEPEFWFESFQNWQSEFLAVAAIVLLSISLRQIGSSQSKGLTVPNHKTGDS